jgi:hypothetical protein
VDITQTGIDKFKGTEKLVRPKTGCWEWQGPLNNYGYGVVRASGHTWLAHRVSCFLSAEKFVDDLCVCHHCDNRKCVRPEHLFQGTVTENHEDMQHKDRLKFGDGHHWSTITAEDAAKIRNLHKEGSSPDSLAARYSITPEMIRLIVRGEAWKRAGGPVRSKQPQIGETHSQAKLTWYQVRDIRSRAQGGETNWSKMAREFAVTSLMISNIARGLAWKDPDALVVAKRVQKGSTHSQAKLSDADVAEIRRLRKDGARADAIAIKFGVHFQYVHRLCRGDRRKSS